MGLVMMESWMDKYAYDIIPVPFTKTLTSDEKEYYENISKSINKQVSATSEWFRSDEAKEFYQTQQEGLDEFFEDSEVNIALDNIINYCVQDANVDDLVERVYTQGKHYGLTEIERSLNFNETDKKVIKNLVTYNYEKVKELNEDCKTSLKEVLVKGVVEGKHPFEIKKEIEKVPLKPIKSNFSLKTRAEMIARTETARAQDSGALQAYSDYGIEKVDVNTVQDGLVCALCQYYEANNPWSLDEAETMLPAHPNCRCNFSVHIGDDMDIPDTPIDNPKEVNLIPPEELANNGWTLKQQEDFFKNADAFKLSDAEQAEYEELHTKFFNMSPEEKKRYEGLQTLRRLDSSQKTISESLSGEKRGLTANSTRRFIKDYNSVKKKFNLPDLNADLLKNSVTILSPENQVDYVDKKYALTKKQEKQWEKDKLNELFGNYDKISDWSKFKDIDHQHEFNILYNRSIPHLADEFEYVPIQYTDYLRMDFLAGKLKGKLKIDSKDLPLKNYSISPKIEVPLDTTVDEHTKYRKILGQNDKGVPEQDPDNIDKLFTGDARKFTTDEKNAINKWSVTPATLKPLSLTKGSKSQEYEMKSLEGKEKGLTYYINEVQSAEAIQNACKNQTKQNLMLYRKLNNSHLGASPQVGDKIRLDGFTSTAISKDGLNGLGTEFMSGHPYNWDFDIEAPKGTQGAYIATISPAHRQMEFLMNNPECEIIEYDAKKKYVKLRVVKNNTEDVLDYNGKGKCKDAEKELMDIWEEQDNVGSPKQKTSEVSSKPKVSKPVKETPKVSKPKVSEKPKESKKPVSTEQTKLTEDKPKASKKPKESKPIKETPKVSEKPKESKPAKVSKPKVSETPKVEETKPKVEEKPKTPKVEEKPVKEESKPVKETTETKPKVEETKPVETEETKVEEKPKVEETKEPEKVEAKEKIPESNGWSKEDQIKLFDNGEAFEYTKEEEEELHKIQSSPFTNDEFEKRKEELHKIKRLSYKHDELSKETIDKYGKHELHLLKDYVDAYNDVKEFMPLPELNAEIMKTKFKISEDSSDVKIIDNKYSLTNDQNNELETDKINEVLGNQSKIENWEKYKELDHQEELNRLYNKKLVVSKGEAKLGQYMSETDYIRMDYLANTLKGKINVNPKDIEHTKIPVPKTEVEFNKDADENTKYLTVSGKSEDGIPKQKKYQIDKLFTADSRDFTSEEQTAVKGWIGVPYNWKALSVTGGARGEDFQIRNSRSREEALTYYINDLSSIKSVENVCKNQTKQDMMLYRKQSQAYLGDNPKVGDVVDFQGLTSTAISKAGLGGLGKTFMPGRKYNWDIDIEAPAGTEGGYIAPLGASLGNAGEQMEFLLYNPKVEIVAYDSYNKYAKVRIVGNNKQDIINYDKNVKEAKEELEEIWRKQDEEVK